MPGTRRVAAGGLPALLVSLSLALAPAAGVSAQEPEALQTQQSVSIIYGDSLTFNIQASAEVPLTGARLTVQVAHREEVYSEAVPLTPGIFVELSHTIPVTALDLPPFAEFTYYWDFQDENGGQYRTDPETLRYEDTGVPWEWVVASRGNVFVHTDGQDETVSRVALEVAIAALTDVSQVTGPPVEDDIHIYVYPELAQLAGSLRLHGRQVQDWVAAYVIPEQRVILVSAASGPELTASLQQDIPHEIAHLAVYLAAGEHASGVPGWFNEGLAITSSAEPDPTLRGVLEEAIREQEPVPSLESLCVASFSHLSPREATLAYAKSESVMRYLISRYGLSQVRALMSGYVDGLSCEGAVQRALGVSLADLEQQWEAELLHDISRSRRDDISLTPWLIVWVISLVLASLFIAPQPSRSGVRSEAEPQAPFSTPSQDRTTG